MFVTYDYSYNYISNLNYISTLSDISYDINKVFSMNSLPERIFTEMARFSHGQSTKKVGENVNAALLQYVLCIIIFQIWHVCAKKLLISKMPSKCSKLTN